MFQSILSNLGVILFGHLLMSTLMNYRERFSKKLVFISIVILFSGVIITIFYLPIQFGGYRLDLRLIPLILLAFFRGWKITIPVLIIVSAWRLCMGGDGAVPGIIFGMILPTLFTLTFYKRSKVLSNYLKKILIITVCWFMSDFPVIFIVPNGREIFQNIFLLRYTSFLGVAFIYYAFIILEYKREDLKRQLEFLAWHDPLTQLLNKNRFIKMVEERMRENNTCQYIAMIDIDHFKKLNDTYGHLAGDDILIKLSAIFRKYESENIKIARYGGEEFIMFIEMNSSEQAIHILEECQFEIRTKSFQIEDEISTNVSVSIGIAKLKGELENAIRQADRSLYIAKEKGRDQLVLAL